MPGGVYCPAVHGAHGVPASLSVSAMPAGHRVQAPAVAAGAKEPAAQRRHGVLGSASWSTVPAGQAWAEQGRADAAAE